MADSSLSSPAAEEVDHLSSEDHFSQNASEKMLVEKKESLDNEESAADGVCYDGNRDDDNSSSDSGEVSEDEENCDHLNDEKNDLNDLSSINRSFNEDEMDDRSQTPLQDEPETENQSENSELKNQDKLDLNEAVIKDEADNESTKENAMNDDHGELDYEEDDDDSIEKSKAEIKVQEQTSAFEVQKPIDDEAKETEKQSNAGEGSHSSDGELADDDDCEEGEIKEPGAKKPFSRPLCRFFNRGSCTWGINCRFLHPGVNDKGNYTMLEQQHQYVQPPPPHLPGMLPLLRGPPPSPWMHERLGKRMPPPPRLSEMAGESEFVGVGAVEGMSASESAWERGLRHAKEIRSKRKETDGDDKKGTSTSPFASGKLIHPSTSSHLAPPPPRDPYYEDLHQTLSTSLPGLPPMPLPMPAMLHHPVDAWLYRHPFEYEVRWPRPPTHPLDYMHPPGFHPHVHDFRMMDPGRGRRFSPPLRIEAGSRVGGERASRADRHHASEGTTNSGEGRGKCEEWKDPWSRAKSPKNKRSSSSRSRSGQKSRSKRRYSSFSSSSYSSKSRSRSSSFSSYSSSRSSFSSRSRSSSKLSKSIPKKVVPVGSLDRSAKNSDISKSIASKVLPPCIAEMNDTSSVAGTTATKLSGTASTTTNQAAVTVTSSSSSSEPSRPAMTSLSITLGTKPSLSSSKTNQLQPVNKSVADAFKDADEDNNDGQMKNKYKLGKLPTSSSSSANTNLLGELNKVGGQVTTAGGVTYKSGIVQGNVGYPIPIKSSAPPPATTVQSKPKSVHSVKKTSEKKKRSRSRGSSASSNDSLTSFSSSRSSHSSSSSNSNAYSDMASPISSDSSTSHKKNYDAKLPPAPSHVVPHLRTSDYPMQKVLHPFAADQRMGRGFRDGRGGSFRGERRDLHVEGRGAGQGVDVRTAYRRNARIDERGMHPMDYSARNMEHVRVDPKMYSRSAGRVGQMLDARMDVRDHRMSERMLPKKEEKREDERRQQGRRMNQPVIRRMSREHDKPQSNNRDHHVVGARYQRREGEGEGDALDANWNRQSPGEYRRVVNKSTVGNKHQEMNAPLRSSQRQHELPPSSSSRKRPSSPNQMRPHEKHMKMSYENKEFPSSGSSRQLASSRQQRSSAMDDVNRKSPAAKYGKMQATTSESKKSTSSRREELLMQLKAVEDAIAKKRSKNQ